MLISIALVSGSLLLWPILQGAVAAGLEPSAAVQLINRQKAVVIDVCEAAEFASGHIVGAKNVPLAELEEGLVITGTISDIWLYHGCQIDIGYEFDG